MSVRIRMLLLSLIALLLAGCVDTTKFEYRACQVQEAKVTYVNGKWQGRIALTQNTFAEAFKSCPDEWEYLGSAGNEGWLLVSAVEVASRDTNARILYFRREQR